MYKYTCTTQNKGTEYENSYQKLKRSLMDRHSETVSKYFDGRTGTPVFLNQKICLFKFSREKF